MPTCRDLAYRSVSALSKSMPKAARMTAEGNTGRTRPTIIMMRRACLRVVIGLKRASGRSSGQLRTSFDETLFDGSELCLVRSGFPGQSPDRRMFSGALHCVEYRYRLLPPPDEIISCLYFRQCQLAEEALPFLDNVPKVAMAHRSGCGASKSAAVTTF